MKIEFFIVFNLFYIFATLEEKMNKYKKKILIIQIIILTFLTSVRENTPDLDFYEFIYINQMTQGIEKGYIFMQKISYLFKLNFYEFKILIALISISLILIGFFKISKRPLLTNFIYFSLIFIEKPYIQMRNSLAVGFFLLGISFFMNKKEIIKSKILILLSMLFHFTGYVYLIFFLFLKNIIKKRKIVFGIGFLSIILSVIFIKIDYQTLVYLSEFELGPFSRKLRLYLFSENGQKQFFKTKIGLNGIFSILIYLYFLLTYKYNEEKQNIFIILGAFSILFRLAAYNITPFNRIVGIFNVVDPLIYSSLFNLKFREKKQKYYYSLIYSICIYIYCYWILNNTIKILKI